MTDAGAPAPAGLDRQGLGAVGHHAWLLIPTDTGCVIHTEETQRGTAIRLLAPLLRQGVRAFHQRWVEGAAKIAESGRLP